MSEQKAQQPPTNQKIEYEKLRHKNIMTELRFMAKHNIKTSPRGGVVVKSEQEK